MSFKTEEHDVTCLCALVDLPKRVIVEELPSRSGGARFRAQAFVERDVGELLDWLAPALKGARLRRWEGAFVFAELEVPADRAAFVRQMLRAIQRNSGEELRVAAWLAEAHEPLVVRPERLAGALAW